MKLYITIIILCLYFTPALATDFMDYDNNDLFNDNDLDGWIMTSSDMDYDNNKLFNDLEEWIKTSFDNEKSLINPTELTESFTEPVYKPDSTTLNKQKKRTVEAK